MSNIAKMPYWANESNTCECPPNSSAPNNGFAINVSQDALYNPNLLNDDISSFSCAYINWPNRLATHSNSKSFAML